ncbi:hypothetical protein N836_20805 [Leptolyngbya sp. Heron Island J]|uniref:hypothetical protein n=1 Tax=Leptolyngbya sp. Heron Island J TaxID=1385935 RepID=UPI0003B9DFA9|nr:hypothetical protein [Leptolyngbya sp. Heron Island J]ESA33613.1 hypothetical protein N836_20805 [Leptolyngbya sp. Heron Island J]
MIRRLALSLGLLVSIWSAGTTFATAAELDVVDSATLGTHRNLPWSEPVQIDDPFEGSFIGVFDRHSFSDRFLNTTARIEVQSLWSRDFIRVLSIIRDRDCLSGSFRVSSDLSCSEFSNARNIIQLFIKFDGDVFQVDGQNNVFSVSDELAQALQNAPETTLDIRLVTESGEAIDSKIGEGTVRAWKTVYATDLAQPL